MLYIPSHLYTATVQTGDGRINQIKRVVTGSIVPDHMVWVLFLLPDSDETIPTCCAGTEGFDSHEPEKNFLLVDPVAEYSNDDTVLVQCIKCRRVYAVNQSVSHTKVVQQT